MILSAEYTHGQDKMGSPMMPPSMLHSSGHSLYTSYLMEPAWHHPIVPKQEPEDSSANNDSGISPSHYNSDGSVQNTSPQSHHSEAQSEDSGHVDREDHQTNATLGILARPIMEAPESPRNASLGHLPQSHSPQQLSPRVGSSPRLTPPQQPVFPGASPQRMSPLQFPPGTSVTPLSQPKDESSRSPGGSSSEMEYYDNPLRGLQMALQRTGMMGPMQSEQSVTGEKPLQCPLCPFSTILRSVFNNHLMTEHGEQASCHLCDHTAENQVKLKEHLKTEHDLQLGPEDEAGSWGEDDEQGITTPRVNSQGKVKTYRCKHCEFKAVIKLDYWEHTKVHIKPERVLTCPKCPFITEYKHHLEYHLRNHVGSKPFKCDKCSYSCVNKSMLNSHLKSHSNVYQFRCADCAYATKYCHSLKLHLRKYSHNPAMVLNPDGSPNPLPIVDVYGTRRGPKRPKKPEEMPSQQTSLPSLHPMFPNPYGFLHGQGIPYPYNTIMNSFPNTPLMPFPNSNHVMQENHSAPKSDQVSLFNAAINTIQQSAINNNQEGVKEYLTRVVTSQKEIMARNENAQENIQEDSNTASTGAPLDLSRPEPEQQTQEPTGEQGFGESSILTKNRRKGKAFKLERIAQRLQQQSSDEEEVEMSPKRLKFDQSSEHVQEQNEIVSDKSSDVEDKPSSPNVNFCEPNNGEFRLTISEERKERWKNVKEVYDCPYCDMLFGDVVMYTMHMGYHGYQNPYTCNMCGHQTADKVQFLLHLFRFAHK